MSKKKLTPLQQNLEQLYGALDRAPEFHQKVAEALDGAGKGKDYSKDIEKVGKRVQKLEDAEEPADHSKTIEKLEGQVKDLSDRLRATISISGEVSEAKVKAKVAEYNK